MPHSIVNKTKMISLLLVLLEIVASQASAQGLLESRESQFTVLINNRHV